LSRMLFSVLIANYNNSRYLEAALNSVINQNYTDWEIILVDDGSTDGFDELIKPYKNHSKIKIWLNDKNEGCGFTKRKCAEKANGILMGFLDPDDALRPDALKIMAEAHSINPSCSIISSTHFICNELLEVKRIASYPSALPAGTPYLLIGDGSIHHFASFKKICYDGTDGISPLNKKAVDQDLYYKLEETGDTLFIDQPLYYYRIHSGGISNAGREGEAIKNHYAIAEEACLRRIKNLKEKLPASKYWIKKYRTRYFKIKIFSSFRKRKWGVFMYALIMFPFVGGIKNITSYLWKLPREGVALLKHSFVKNYEIKL
jgi:glycosyltransferase involved in cell wall biosynthesis